MPTPLSNKGYDFEAISHAVIGACIDVQRQLRVHCMEVDHQRALGLALRKRGLYYQREVHIPIAYDGVVITRRVEQCLLYLHQGRYRLCLLVNFGQKPLGLRRFVHTPAGPGGGETSSCCPPDQPVPR